MTKTKKPRTTEFRFKHHHPIGAIQAEFDQEFLDNCFIDTGDFDALTDIENPRALVIGRTGSGKTALLYHLKQSCQNVIEIEPENLSIDYIANSNILQFFQEAGVNLDVLFRLLWRHVIVVELLQYYFDIRDESAMQWCQRQLADLLQNNKKQQQALDYLTEWGDTFWENTEYRVREVVQHIETELAGGLTLGNEILQGGAGAAYRLDESDRREVIERGKQAVQKVQIKALGDVVRLLGEHIFVGTQKRYYVLIDRLDENWASDDIRYKLIRALIEEIRTFRSITPLKVIVCVRLDLIERVFKEASDTGFQEEKYRDLMMPLRWNKEHLHQLTEARINYLLRHKYTTQTLTFNDIFPNKVGKRKTFDYILDRTAYRPRDLINFMNYVLEAAVGKSSITQATVRRAEEPYSEDRARSLVDEWHSVYPCFSKYLALLESRHDGFRINSLSKEELDKLALDLIQESTYGGDPVGSASEDYLNGNISPAQFRLCIVHILYYAGAVGIKKDSTSGTRWVFDENVIRTTPNTKSDSRVYIHPMLWRTFSINLNTSA